MKNKPIKKFSQDDLLKKPIAKKPKETLAGNHIRDILDEREMTQAELSDLSGVPTQHLSRIVNNQRKCISLPIAIKIARALKLPVEEVFIYKNTTP